MKIIKKKSFFLSLILKVLHNRHSTQFDGIAIIDFSKKNNASDQTIFEETIIDSLKLIKHLTPIEYHRLLTQIDSITYSKKIREDTYITISKIYATNGLTQWKDTKLMHIYYAGILVYLSTYGCLLSKKSDYYMEDKFKIYDLCIKIEKRFYTKVENLYPEYKDLLITKFLGS